MKRLIAIMMLGLCAASSAQAQSYFNLRDPLHSFGTVLTTVIPTQQGYICTGVAWDSSNHISGTTAWQIIGVKFATYNHAGQKLRDTIFEQSHLHIGWQAARNIYAGTNTTQRFQDGSVVSLAQSFDSANVMRIGLIKLDSLGRGQWFKEIDNPFCPGVSYPQAYLSPSDLKPDGQGGWLVLSSIICGSSAQSDMLLTKLDSAFTVVWHRSYGTSNRNEVSTKIGVEPDGYLLAGGYNNVNAVAMNFIHQAQFIKTDTAGNVQWTWRSDPAKKIYSAADVVRTQDGGYLYCGWGDGLERLSANGQSATMYWSSWVEKLDANRNPEWNRVLSDIRWGYGTNELTVAKELPNGDVVVAGGLKHRPSPPDSFTQGYGQLARLAPDGNIRWRRKYRYAADTFEHTVHDMKPTPDGGFVLVGQSTDQKYPYNPPTQQGWIIKVDSNGCTSNNDPQCWPTAIQPVALKRGLALVYPNPAASALTVRYISGSQAALLHTTDLAGRRILQSTLRNGETPLDISHLQPGLYLWRITEGGMEKAHGKFVKQ